MVSATSQSAQAPARSKRADALRNQQTLLDAAAAVFVRSGVDAPVREIAAEAAVGIGTIYRHFPTRADLIVAVYRHQVESCAEAGPALLARAARRSRRWAGGSTSSLISWSRSTDWPRAANDDSGFDALHAYFLDRLMPVCAHCSTRRPRPARSARHGPLRTDARHRQPLHGRDSDPRYDARRLVELLLRGLQQPR